MKLRFKHDVELQVFESPETSRPELFIENEIIEVDICDFKEPPIASELQFGNGDVTFVDSDFWNHVEIIES
jgi:hypothetical protein